MAAELRIDAGYEVEIFDVDNGVQVTDYKEKQVIKQLQSGDLIANINDKTICSMDDKGKISVEYTFQLNPTDLCELNWSEL